MIGIWGIVYRFICCVQPYTLLPCIHLSQWTSTNITYEWYVSYAHNTQYISLRNEGPARSFLVWFLLVSIRINGILLIDWLIFFLIWSQINFWDFFEIPPQVSVNGCVRPQIRLSVDHMSDCYQDWYLVWNVMLPTFFGVGLGTKNISRFFFWRF